MLAIDNVVDDTSKAIGKTATLELDPLQVEVLTTGPSNGYAFAFASLRGG